MGLGRIAAIAAPLGLLPLVMGATAVHAASSAFTPPVQLLGARGGEPSIDTDRLNNVYVTGPQGIPAGAKGKPGVGVWVSHDDATSFTMAALAGSFAGGGDSDVSVAPDDHSVFIADLEAAAAAVCRSTDTGATFKSIGPFPDPANCGGVTAGQAGPSNDREWLTAGTKGVAYLTYHEFVSAQPVIFRTDNSGGDLFLAGPCGSIVTDPAIEANVPQDITGGTLVSKPVLDAAGNLYVLFTTTTQKQNVEALPVVSGTFSNVYLAVSKDKCHSFTDHIVYEGDRLGPNQVQFGDIFNDLAIDGAGNLYAIGAGFISQTPKPANTANLFLFSSTDGGTKWSGPHQVTLDAKAANVLPAAIGGPKAGDLALGYFRTTNGTTDPNDAKGMWTYTTAESTNATSTEPSFSIADVTPGPTIYHAGDICTSGILCGLPLPGVGQDRTLADFTSATIDQHGCPIFTFAGNPNGKTKTEANPNGGTFNFVTRQTSGCFPLPEAAVVPPSQPRSGTQGATIAVPNTGGGPSAELGAGLALIGSLALAGRRRRRSA
ncbi:MAG: hypothetical protein NVSMB29_07740 [Candidatus Dormibacteria bacterium]